MISATVEMVYLWYIEGKFCITIDKINPSISKLLQREETIVTTCRGIAKFREN